MLPTVDGDKAEPDHPDDEPGDRPVALRPAEMLRIAP